MAALNEILHIVDLLLQHDDQSLSFDNPFFVRVATAIHCNTVQHIDVL